MEELRACVRDLADCVRDLAHAQALSAGAHASLGAEGQARGETVMATVRGFHKGSERAVQNLTSRVDALNIQVQQSTAARIGAPWWLVSVLVVAVIIQGGVTLSLYARSNGDDAPAAFRDARLLLPSLPPAAEPEPKPPPGATTPTEQP